jgi:hypothetical protein
MWAMNRLANSLASMSVWHGMRYHSFVSQSTTTQIASQPSDYGSPVMKSIEMSCQGHSGIGSSLNTPNGVCRFGLEC